MANFQPTEAIEFLKQRLALPDEVWQALIEQVDAAARSRALDMSRSMHEDILKAIQKALEEGTTKEMFRKEFDRISRSRGWKGDNEGGYRSNLVFRTQTSQAMASGRWQTIQRVKKRFPYLRYVTVGDHRVRKEHLAWHDTILPVDHPWWLTHYPPNGFNCRCRIMQLNDSLMKRFGFEVSEQAPPMNVVEQIVRDGNEYKKVSTPQGIDPGFAYNAGERGLLLLKK
ncbi:MAG: phage minor head protein [Rhizobiaceae bacterium]